MSGAYTGDGSWNDELREQTGSPVFGGSVADKAKRALDSIDSVLPDHERAPVPGGSPANPDATCRIVESDPRFAPVRHTIPYEGWMDALSHAIQKSRAGDTIIVPMQSMIDTAAAAIKTLRPELVNSIHFDVTPAAEPTPVRDIPYETALLLIANFANSTRYLLKNALHSDGLKAVAALANNDLMANEFFARGTATEEGVKFAEELLKQADAMLQDGTPAPEKK